MSKQANGKMTWKSKGWALLTGLLCTLAATAICAALVMAGWIDPKASVICAAVSAAIGAFAGAYMTAKAATEKKLASVGVYCLMYLMVLLMGNLLFVPQPPIGAVRLLTISAGAGLLACLLANTRAGGRKRRR